MKTILRLSALALVAALSLAAGPAANWNVVVNLGPNGSHVLGNPKAQLKLTEYVSYTCPHCAEFEREADGPLRLGYVRSGKLSIEVKHMLRDPIDLTVAMLTNCGPKEKFFLNHSMMMRSQATWIRPLVSASKTQQSRWTTGEMAARNRAIAADFHLYDVMATRGYDRVTVDRCLADKAMADRIAAQAKDGDSAGVESTPSFLLNGQLLLGTSAWSLLKPQIDARL